VGEPERLPRGQRRDRVQQPGLRQRRRAQRRVRHHDRLRARVGRQQHGLRQRQRRHPHRRLGLGAGHRDRREQHRGCSIPRRARSRCRR
jgi:hypothetical protein